MSKDSFLIKVEQLLEENRVSPVIRSLREAIGRIPQEHSMASEFKRRLDTAADTYRYMRNFLLDGAQDSSRADIYLSIKEDLRQLAADIKFVAEMNTSNFEFYASYRFARISKDSLSDLLQQYRKTLFHLEKAGEMDVDSASLIKKKEDLLDRIFRYVWTSPAWQKEDTAVMRDILLSEHNDFILRSQVLSALLLSLYNLFDRQKVRFILEAYLEEADERMAARLLTVILILADRWNERIKADRELMGNLETIGDSILTYTRLRDVVMTLIRTRDTDRVSNEIKQTFDLAMKNISPELMERIREEGFGAEAGELEENPEWEKIMKENNLEEKLQDINDMQMKGMDVMMESFGRLKSFPFFHALPHWFMPFDPTRSEITAVLSDENLKSLSTIADIMEICASDRYSFVMGFGSMPEDRRNMVISHIGAANDMMKEQFGEDIPTRKSSVFARESLSFSRNLYRFFKLYPKRQQFADIFRDPIDFMGLPVFGALLGEDEMLGLIGNFYFEYGYYDLALPLLLKTAENGTSEMQLYEKIGYCRQMSGDFQGAIAEYGKADLFSSEATPVSSWLLRKLAFCNRVLKRYDEAVKYYERLVERDADDRHAELNLGNVLILAGDVEEGMKHLSKLHYLEPEDRAVTRAYLRGMFLRGDDSDTLASTAAKLASSSPAPEDWRLIGHAALIGGRYRDAAEAYDKGRDNMTSIKYRHKLRDELNFLSPKRFDSIALDIILDNPDTQG